jgi:hypothetical protein
MMEDKLTQEWNDSNWITFSTASSPSGRTLFPHGDAASDGDTHLPFQPSFSSRLRLSLTPVNERSQLYISQPVSSLYQ